MFTSTHSISPITQAEVAYRADRARRGFAGARRRRLDEAPFFGPAKQPAGRAD